MDFNAPLIDLVPASIYANGSVTRSVKVVVAKEYSSQALDIFVKAFKKLTTKDWKDNKHSSTISDYLFIPFQLNI